MSTIRRSIQLRAALPGAQLRTGELKGRDYLIIPVIALKGDIVFSPMGSAGPEFVPSKVLEESVKTWANRPAVLDHPIVDGEPVSALKPEVLEIYAFGSIFNPYFDGDLKFDVWLSEVDAVDVDGATDAITRLKAGEQLEVSIGASVLVEKRDGVHNGEKYNFVWLDINSDHIAILGEGKTGACSNADGCRAGETTVNNPKPIASQPNTVFRFAHGEHMTKAQRKAMLAARKMEAAMSLNGEPSDRDLRDKLTQKLYGSVSTFDWLGPVYPTQGLAVYEGFTDGDINLYTVSFSLVDGEIELGDDHTKVEATVVFKPINSSNGNDANKGATMKASKEVLKLVNSLIGCEKCKFTEDNRKDLEGMSEGVLKVLVANSDSKDNSDSDSDSDSDTKHTTASNGSTVDDKSKASNSSKAGSTDAGASKVLEAKDTKDAKDTKVLSLAEYNTLKAAADKLAAQTLVKRTATIASITGVNSALTKDYLEGQTDEQLEVLASAIKAPDTVQYPSAAIDDDVKPIPSGWDAPKDQVNQGN